MCWLCDASSEANWTGQASSEAAHAPKPSFDYDQAADQIAWGGWSGAGNGTVNITYAFRSSDSSDPGFSRLQSHMIEATEAAFDLWADVANITFQRVGSGTSGESAYSNDATIRIGADTDSGGYAWAYYPGSTWHGSVSGDIFFNTSNGYFQSAELGSYSFLAVMHEIGHAIGLAHPGTYNGGSPTYANDASYAEDSRQFTVMSYFAAEETGAEHYWTYAATPLLHDIAAVQFIYGANYETRSDDTTYGFNSNADRESFHIDSAAESAVFAIWDGGGTDTLDLSGYRDDQTVNLLEEGFSDAGGLVANIAIARGAVIENGISGAGDDTLIGNGAANHLVGNAGKDTIVGGDGNDTLNGNSSNDTLRGEAGNDVLLGGKHKDYLYGGEGDDQLAGDTGDDYLYGDGGADTIVGGSGHDRIWGGDGDDVIDGGSGDEKIYAGAGDDHIAGGSGYDTLDYSAFSDGVTIDMHAHTATGASSGNDTLWGIEQVDGTIGDDTFKGDLRDNVFRGRDGDDVFRGLQGADTYKGGPGVDTYVWRTSDVWRNDAHQGVDTILDFSVTQDVLDLTGLFDDVAFAEVGDVVALDERAEGTMVRANIAEAGWVDVVLLGSVVGANLDAMADGGHLLA